MERCDQFFGVQNIASGVCKMLSGQFLALDFPQHTSCIKPFLSASREELSIPGPEHFVHKAEETA
jgi:hypothetical protein